MDVPRTDILVIEPDPRTSALFRLLLEDAGYGVRCADSLAEADRMLTDKRPDLVVSEVRLPDGPPFALLGRLDADPATRELPLLLCTAALSDLLRDGAWRGRARTGVVPKPFDIDRLLECIGHLRDGRLPDLDPALLPSS